MAQQLRILQSLWAMERRRADEAEWPLERQLPSRAGASRRDDCGSHFLLPTDRDPKATKRLQRACAADIPCGMWMANRPLSAARAHSAQRRRAWGIGVTIALALAALCFVLGLAAPAYAQSPLIQGWLAANTQCKGSLSNDPKTLKACETRDRLSAKLKRRGCSYREDGDWWKCPH